jgi:hypothetical protein
MNIKDLAVSNELSHEERAAVRGGSQSITMIGSAEFVGAGSGLTVVTQQNGQYASQYNSTMDTTNLVNLFGVQNAGVSTFTL